MFRIAVSRFTLCLMLAGLASPAARAGDWPQILGPNRDGHAVRETLADRWPADGPKKLWERPVGSGFAGIVVQGDQAILFHRQEDQEFVECLAVKTGETLWKTGFPTRFVPAIVDDDGPRSTPVIHDGAVLVVGAEGAVRCLELKTGAKRWEVKPLKEYSAPNSYFGAGGSPLVAGKLVLVNTGADRQGAGLSAFDLATGKAVWQTSKEIESYSSPVLAKLKPGLTAVFVTRLNVVGVDPENGRERFRFPFGQRGPTVNGAAPVVFDDHLFVTASYGIGAVVAQVGAGGVEPVWESDDVLSSQYPTPVYHEGKLYGIHGRQDAGPAELRCVDALTQKVLWKVPSFGMASVVWADGKLLIQKTDGELVLAKGTPEAFQPLGQGTVGQSTVRALPALAGGRWFVRDEQRLRCFDLQK